MHVCYVSDEVGWPANSGYRARLCHVARALGALGALDWFVCTPDPDGARVGPVPGVPGTPVHVPVRLLPRRRLPLAWAASRLPWRVAAIDRRRTRAALAAALDPAAHYDLVVFSHLDTLLVAGDVFRGRTRHMAVDLDNLESSLVDHELAALGAEVGTPRRIAKRVDRARWSRLEARAARRAVRAYVCSALDVARLTEAVGRGGTDPAVAVLANGTPRPDAGYVRAPHPHHPVLVFVGSMSYEPNIDAVEHMVADVLPLVRAECPDAELRIVGRDVVERVQRLAAAPGVTIVGEVASVAPELAQAHVAVAPIRFGGGTRVKILEAFAHEVPVVTTTVGGEGLDLEHDVHALVADDPASFAAACIRALRDPASCAPLVQAGAALARERYDWPTIERELAADLRAAVARDPR